jgi:hypothetical protein
LIRAKEPVSFSTIEPEGNTPSELEVIGNKLIFNYPIHRRSTKEYIKNFLKFLSILAYLENLYDPELSSLYPSIVEVLMAYADELPYKDGKIENSELLIKQIKLLSSMNCSLSLQILDFQLRCKNLELENDSLAKFSKDAIDGAMGRIATKDSNDDALPRVIGTTSEAYKTAKSFIFNKVMPK